MRNNVLKLLSFIGTACVIVPPVLYLAGTMDKPLMKGFMLAGTLLWFATVPFWMGKQAE